MHGLLLRMVPVPKKSTWRKPLKSNPMTGITCVAGEKNPLPLVGKEIFVLKICYTLWTMMVISGQISDGSQTL